ncbi:NADH dehydrogenase [ubiquinone] 1 beta subcomplex subunit 2, mitochondrial-like [Tubulanus polymorphus]|uniref:NADH dehydrogenase [ubiquinone] 1 beta subcomplex subunit 2, mitochondrial-like n=1 Tax=Tubulanus polymorphus TaxID=672921 RepID=UPI003DA4E569
MSNITRLFQSLRCARQLTAPRTKINTLLLRNGSSSTAWTYRKLSRTTNKKHLLLCDLMGGLMWWWILWHFWTEPEHIYGHYEYPDTSKWTDAELGIPPDDED